jgi:hypothetical protein
MVVREQEACGHRGRLRAPHLFAEGSPCLPVDYQTPSPNTRPRSAILRGLVFSASYGGGRRWYRTTDPLLVSQRQAYQPITGYSIFACDIRYLAKLRFRPDCDDFGLFWRLVFTSVHQENRLCAYREARRFTLYFLVRVAPDFVSAGVSAFRRAAQYAFMRCRAVSRAAQLIDRRRAGAEGSGAEAEVAGAGGRSRIVRMMKCPYLSVDVSSLDGQRLQHSADVRTSSRAIAPPPG